MAICESDMTKWCRYLLIIIIIFCTDIDEDGNFRIVASLRIEGNEELINRLRGKDGQRNFKALEGAEDIAATIEEIKRRGGRTNWNIPSSKRQSRTNGRNDSVHLGQQAKPRRNQRPSDKNDGQSESHFKINDKDNISIDDFGGKVEKRETA